MESGLRGYPAATLVENASLKKLYTTLRADTQYEQGALGYG